MITDAHREKVKITLRRFIASKSPSTMKFLDLLNKLCEKPRDRLLNDHFRDSLNVVKEKAKPFLWAYVAGCCAPMRHPRKPARSA